jgi:GTP cyclohydrolase II
MATAFPSSIQLRPSVSQPRTARARIESTAELPTEFGVFRVHVFSNNVDSHEHVALVRGDVAGARDVPTRMHSECLTGDALASLRCDCRAQLQRALSQLGKEPVGVLLYLRQEGRGIGLTNKIRAYHLQEQGYDTVDANLALGFAADERDYSVAAAMLRTLGVESVALMTNNPDKIQKLSAGGIEVTERLAHEIEANPHNRAYLETKARRSGHLLQLAGLSAAPRARGPSQDDGRGE